MERYYVNGVCLDVDHSTLIYDFYKDIFLENETHDCVYRTNSGCFFRVISGNAISKDVKILMIRFLEDRQKPKKKGTGQCTNEG